MRAFRSEWIKLSRRATLLGFGGAIVGFAALITVLMFLGAGGTDIGTDEGRGPGALASAATLSLTDGSVFAVTRVATFLTIIALALFASNLAGEFSKGTIRMLFVTEPRRIKALAGKLAALASFAAAWVAVAVGVSIALGAVLASSAGVDTTSWWTAEGFAAMAGAYASLTGAMIAAGLVGAALAVLTRSSAISISVGTAYLMIVEPLVGTFWETLGEWGPAAAFGALADGGTTSIGYSVAAALTIAYGLAGLAISSGVISRRDVTS